MCRLFVAQPAAHRMHGCCLSTTPAHGASLFCSPISGRWVELPLGARACREIFKNLQPTRFERGEKKRASHACVSPHRDTILNTNRLSKLVHVPLEVTEYGHGLNGF